MSGAGHLGRNVMMTRMSARVAPPTMSVGICVRPTTEKNDCNCSTMLSPSTEVPVTLPSWPTIISTAPPAR